MSELKPVEEICKFWDKWYRGDYFTRRELAMELAKIIIEIVETTKNLDEKKRLYTVGSWLNSYFEDLTYYLEHKKEVGESEEA